MSNVPNESYYRTYDTNFTKILLRCYLLSENDIDNENKIFI